MKRIYAEAPHGKPISLERKKRYAEIVGSTHAPSGW